jgi:hypothetical protein
MFLKLRPLASKKNYSGTRCPYPYTLLLQLHRQHKDADVVMKKHVKLLHKYNESKDVTREDSAE